MNDRGGRAARISPQENIHSQTDGLFRVDQRVCPVEPGLKDACIQKPAEVQRCDPRMGILAALCSPLVGKAVEKFDPRLIVFLGILGLAAIMLWRMWSFSNDVTFLQMAWPTLVTGVFMVMFFVPVTGLAMASVDPEEQANAAGLSNFMRTLAGAFATSLVQSGWSDATRANNTEIVNSMRHGQAAVDAMTAQGMPDEAARTMLSYVVEGQSVMLATLDMFGVIAVCLGISAAIIWLVPKPKGPIDTSGAH